MNPLRLEPFYLKTARCMCVALPRNQPPLPRRAQICDDATNVNEIVSNGHKATDREICATHAEGFCLFTIAGNDDLPRGDRGEALPDI